MTPPEIAAAIAALTPAIDRLDEYIHITLGSQGEGAAWLAEMRKYVVPAKNAIAGLEAKEWVNTTLSAANEGLIRQLYSANERAVVAEAEIARLKARPTSEEVTAALDELLVLERRVCQSSDIAEQRMTVTEREQARQRLDALLRRLAAQSDGWRNITSPVSQSAGESVGTVAETSAELAGTLSEAGTAAPPADTSADDAARASLGLAPFDPHIIELTDAGLREFVIRDCATITQHGEHYDTLIDMETREVVGFAWPIRKSVTAPPSPSARQTNGAGDDHT